MYRRKGENTMTNRNNTTISGYITNLGKYNEGYLIGEWIDFPISDEDLAAVLERIGVSDEPDENGCYYEEYFFTDWETSISGLSANLGEYVSIDDVNEIAEKIEEYGEIAEAIVEVFGIDDLMNGDPDDYMLWSVNNDEELGEEVAGVCGVTYELPEHLRYYFDFAAYGRDYAMETNGGWCDAGYIEYIG